MKSVMVIIGTRPEALKMAPVILALKARPDVRAILCVTAQHREMLDQALHIFDLKPDLDLNLMRPSQELAELSTRVLMGVRDGIRQFKPDAVLVQGDTTTSLMGALAAFYERVPVGHVEAGLRTHDMSAPWPEEMNRRLIDPICRWCFAPTEQAAANLRAERIPESQIYVTGNTALDALRLAEEKLALGDPGVKGLGEDVLKDRRLVLVTGHRRENFGGGLEQLCLALRDLVQRNPDILVVYPVHMNPQVLGPVSKMLGAQPRIKLMMPQSYLKFVWLMQRSTVILTDSGGIQEEAPSLGTPVLVLRETTERPEAVGCGAAKIVGMNRNKIVVETESILNAPHPREALRRIANPYGDGRAAQKIVDILV